VTRPLLALLLALWPTLATAENCKPLKYNGNRYAICTVDLRQDHLRMWLNTPQNRPYRQFDTLDQALRAQGQRLTFAMNAGMYHKNRAPVGLYVEKGKTLASLITSDGPGNFGLLPNGVLCLQPRRADIIETRAFKRLAPTCTFATQSGPMLVIEGKLHPKFKPGSRSKYRRNGVGILQNGRVAVFALSENRVNLHDFASLFRDHLKTQNALYLDGAISRLYHPATGRHDLGFDMGPIIGTVDQTAPAR
jgi:uncharacterized protein YigE (DUF2233 family)